MWVMPHHTSSSALKRSLQMEFLDERPRCWLIGTALKATRTWVALWIAVRHISKMPRCMKLSLLGWKRLCSWTYVAYVSDWTHFHACIHINAKCMHTLACETESTDAHLSQVILCGALLSEIWHTHTHTLLHRSRLKPLTACANTSSWINPRSRSIVCC